MRLYDCRNITYIDARTKLHLLQYLDSRDDDNPALIVSNNRPHSRLAINTIEILISDLGKRSGIKECYPHKFRASTATRAIDKGL